MNCSAHDHAIDVFLLLLIITQFKCTELTSRQADLVFSDVNLLIQNLYLHCFDLAAILKVPIALVMPVKVYFLQH